MDNHKKVLVGGCFDLLHFGHISFLKKARSLGNYLIVALESDANTKKLKGPNRPIHNQKQRRQMLESLRFVDKVISLSDSPDYEQLVRKIKPRIIAVTAGDSKLKQKRLQAGLVGAKVVVIPKIKSLSTSQIAKLLKID